MARISDADKKARKERVRLIIRQNYGIRESEIVKEIGFGQRTVNNYLNELEREGKIEKRGVLWYEQYYVESELRRFTLSPEQAITLYILIRLFVKQTDKRNEIAERLLARLAGVLHGEDIVTADILEASQELVQREERTGYLAIYRTILQAYVFRRRVKIDYQPANAEPFETELDIYLIEPSSFGHAIYLIGESQRHDKVWTYKLERVTSAEILKPKYNIPADFPGLAYLRNAWSIYSGDKTVRVLLRFSEAVKSRVLESNWHFSQGHEELPDGSLHWWVDVADTIDIFPWIRQWGSAVEIIRPRRLREEMGEHVKQLSELYQLRPPTTMLLHQLLYGKTKPRIHRLLYHLIDVGQVALGLWKYVFAAGFRNQVAAQLDTSPDNAGRFLAFVIGLHDLGKATPAYQAKYAPPFLIKQLHAAGLQTAKSAEHFNHKTNTVPHATATVWALPALLNDLCDATFASEIGNALGGHHGNWPSLGATDDIRDDSFPEWDKVRRDLAWEMRAVFQPQSVKRPLQIHERQTLLTLISGLTSVADWIGSREQDFEPEAEPWATNRYAAHSAEIAQRVLQELGWCNWRPTGEAQSFHELFRYLNFDRPRDLQQQIITLTAQCSQPTLAILEAPTGSGKTEIALYLADKWLQENHGRGIYIAMPTQATSNQLHERTSDFIEHRYGKENAPLLIHGQSFLSDPVDQPKVSDIGEREADTTDAAAWFTEKRKRSLLYPFGVGTVDQTLLSILNSNHFFVRLFGLSHKIVIFDEVHAYDTFMNVLFQRLLTWLRAVGASVIILSATLPRSTRQMLVEAYTGRGWRPPPDQLPYPALTLASPDQSPQITELDSPTQANKTLEIGWLASRAPQEIVDCLKRQLINGGCAAVICNTVGRAQEIYEAVCLAFDELSDEHLILFHARFPPIWRDEIEQRVKRYFGKPNANGQSPHRPPLAIVIATQVIEQSLDLDFDIMISDLAPIDLVLQRAGRLHRHKRPNRPKVPHRLIIPQPDQTAGKPAWGSDGYIYHPYFLQQTYRLLAERTQEGVAKLTIPQETAQLIEAVYMTAPQDDALRALFKAWKKESRAATRKAMAQLVAKPDDPNLFFNPPQLLEEDNPAIHQAFQAKTRDFAPSVALVCLHQGKDAVLLDPNEPDSAIYLERLLSAETIRNLLKRTVTVHNWTLVNYFSEREESIPKVWRKNALLRHARPVIFKNGAYQFTHNDKQYQLQLSKRLGLQLKEV